MSKCTRPNHCSASDQTKHYRTLYTSWCRAFIQVSPCIFNITGGIILPGAFDTYILEIMDFKACSTFISSTDFKILSFISLFSLILLWTISKYCTSQNNGWWCCCSPITVIVSAANRKVVASRKHFLWKFVYKLSIRQNYLFWWKHSRCCEDWISEGLLGIIC